MRVILWLSLAVPALAGGFDSVAMSREAEARAAARRAEVARAEKPRPPATYKDSPDYQRRLEVTANGSR